MMKENKRMQLVQWLCMYNPNMSIAFYEGYVVFSKSNIRFGECWESTLLANSKRNKSFTNLVEDIYSEYLQSL